MNWKELFTAHYNTLTGTIEGCRPGSLAYYHEARHHHQFKIPAIKWFNFIFNLIYYPGSIFILCFSYYHDIFTGGLAIVGILSIPDLILILLLEIDAWIYCIWKSCKMR